MKVLVLIIVQCSANNPQFFAALFAEDLKRASQPETNKKKTVGDCQNFQHLSHFLTELQNFPTLVTFLQNCSPPRWPCRHSSRSRRTCWWKLSANAIPSSSAASSPTNWRSHWSASFKLHFLRECNFECNLECIKCSAVHSRVELPTAALFRDAWDNPDSTRWLPNQVS